MPRSAYRSYSGPGVTAIKDALGRRRKTVTTDGKRVINLQQNYFLSETAPFGVFHKTKDGPEQPVIPTGKKGDDYLVEQVVALLVEHSVDLFAENADELCRFIAFTHLSNTFYTNVSGFLDRCDFELNHLGTGPSSSPSRDRPLHRLPWLWTVQRLIVGRPCRQ